MPQLRPFRGLRYSPLAAPNLDRLICPPYDVISAAERSDLVARHPANAVRLELPDSYDIAVQLLAAWRNEGTLRLDDRPMIYIYEGAWTPAETADGDGRVRGFFCRLRLEEPASASGVRAHELTMAGPREDRFQLLRAVRANLSPVVMLYQAPSNTSVSVLLDALTTTEPTAQALDYAGLHHRTWAADPEVSSDAAQLLRAASSGALTIADGHHRYATALRYCSEVGRDGADEVMVLLIEAHTGGIVVRPTHRLLRMTTSNPLQAAAELFAVEPISTSDELAAQRPGLIGVWTRAGGARLRPLNERVAPLLPQAASNALRELDVTVLNSTYSALVGSSVADLTASDRIAYTHDAAEAIAAVDSGKADVAFLLAPASVRSVLEVAAAGEVMPPKSTFFYPKPATGLVFNVLDA